MLPLQKDHEHLEKLNAEMQRMEERLQEERMERVKLEVELGREKDCNRVRETTRNFLQSLSLVMGLFWELSVTKTTCTHVYTHQCTNFYSSQRCHSLSRQGFKKFAFWPGAVTFPSLP